MNASIGTFQQTFFCETYTYFYLARTIVLIFCAEINLILITLGNPIVIQTIKLNVLINPFA